MSNLTEARHYGYTDGKKIVIKKHLDDINTLRVFIHECAHYKLHFEKKKFFRSDEFSGIKEAEADATAYVLMRLLNLKQSDIKGSVNYIIQYYSSTQMKKYSIADSMENIMKAVHLIDPFLWKVRKLIKRWCKWQ